jgi:ZIP family zinc transporter
VETLAHHPFLQGVLGSLAAALATGLGALAIFLRRSWSRRSQAILLAGAGGVMLGATVFSLLLPALELGAARGGGRLAGAVTAAGGLVLGALAIHLLHQAVPHEHFVKGPEGSPRLHLGRHWLFVLAITLHNLPEGLSVGLGYGESAAAGLAVMLGIGAQNVPEGLAVAAALVDGGATRTRGFVVALLTGLVEPLGGLLGAAAASTAAWLLPWALAFAAGAMFFVVSGEIIPETHREGRERAATFSLVGGFALMLLLDVLLGG